MRTNGTTLVLRELHTDYISLDQDPKDAVDIGTHSAAFLYLASTPTVTPQTLDILTAARNRSGDYIPVGQVVFQAATTTSTFVYLTQLGRYIRLRSELTPGSQATWEGLVVPKN